MDRKIINGLFDFIDSSPDSYHTIKSAVQILECAGYTEIREGDIPEAGRQYYIKRGQSSLIAFRTPEYARGFTVAASHGDSPCLKVKPNSDRTLMGYTVLNCERYGGFWHSSWFDRPLRISGRAYIKKQSPTAAGIIETSLFELPRPSAVIPSHAIHLDRTMNEKYVPDVARELVPMFGNGDGASLIEAIASDIGVECEDILSLDAVLSIDARGVLFGDRNQFISAPRLDDLMCVYTSLRGFIESNDGKCVPMFCLFDNEEVGSMSKNGAMSDFLPSVARCVASLYSENEEESEETYRRMLRNSFFVSSDNAHAIHPNRPELSDSENAARLNGGIVIKHSAARRYTTDGESAAICTAICERAGVPVQHYSNRSDNIGGSTLGSIASTQFPAHSVDIGAAQLAMHSASETAGTDDVGYLTEFFKSLFSSTVTFDGAEIKINGGTYEA